MRTLALTLLLARTAPLSAHVTAFPPATCARAHIRDSLAQHESSFTPKAKRLQSIVAHVEKQPDTLVILDEILRGTNSMDKHKGSYGLLEKFLALQTVVVIATHDLGIGELATNIPSARKPLFRSGPHNNELFSTTACIPASAKN